MSEEPEPMTIKAAGGSTRTIRARLITWTCQRCHVEHTDWRYPGALPRYCDPCRQIEQNKQAAETMYARRHRKLEPTCPTCNRDLVRDKLAGDMHCWHCNPMPGDEW